MKKLMFSAALVASTVAFGDVTVDNFTAQPGVYAVTFVEKSLDVTYAEGQAMKEPEEISYDYETKVEAEAAATLAAAAIEENDCVVKKITYKRGTGEYAGMYGYQITYAELDKDTVKSSKVVTSTRNGLLFFGYGEADEPIENQFLTWTKDSSNRSECGKYYLAWPTDATFTAWGLGTKSNGGIQLGAEGEAEFIGAGIGAATKTKVLGEYVNFASSLAGNIVSPLTETKDGVVYGTWKLQKDAAATKLADKGKSLADILKSKGLTLAGEEPEEEEAE